MIEKIKNSEAQTSFDAIQNNSLNLAFIGDAVWTLLVRDYFLHNTHFKNNNLHKLTTKFVKATYQAKALDTLQEELTDFEKDIARRARNVKMNTV
jgi:ribonuclease-3 family protein